MWAYILASSRFVLYSVNSGYYFLDEGCAKLIMTLEQSLFIARTWYFIDAVFIKMNLARIEVT